MNRNRLLRLLHAWLVLALLLSNLSMALAARPVRADHTPAPTSVALAGSVQSELGCPGDWQPECALTELTLDATDGIWQKKFAIPAGNWEYKIALNDKWDESYGSNGNNIPLSVTNSLTVSFYYDPITHWVADSKNQTIAVAPGSFQKALGCPDNWQPDCLRSWLQDKDGDGVYTFQTTAIPTGTYEAKVALNESWDVNYGAGGAAGGDNIPFTVKEGDTVTFRYNATTHIPTITSTGDTIDPALSALVTVPVRSAIVNDIFYFVMPDRFTNGVTGNDQGGLSGDRSVTGLDATDKGYYHGGDLAGLTSKLDYLKSMGVTAIWMTPMFKNKPVQGSGNDMSAGYHGYWITDFTQIDPHLGSNAELTTLIQQAHGKGIKVFFDIITNHTADVIQYEGGASAYRNKTDFPYRDNTGTPFDDRDYAGKATFPTLDANSSFAYKPLVPAAEATVKSPSWLNNPLFYHNRGNSSFSGENSLYGDFFGLDDLFTEQPAVVDGMIDIYKKWITDFGIDGFRIDTMKHVNKEFWQKFSPAILSHAKAQGKPDFFIFGEVYSGNEQLLSYYSTALNPTGDDASAVLDFGFQAAARGFASNSGPTDNLKTFFEEDDNFTDENSSAYQLPTFLGNHDMGRIGYFIKTANATANDAELLARSKLAHALMYFGRGVPVVYYGDEQGFVGDGGDKDARQDMMPSKVASYNDDDLIGTNKTTADDNFDATHPLYATLQSYATLVKAHPTLRTGAQIHRYSSNAAGIYAFSRFNRDLRNEYVVALNNAAQAKTASFKVDHTSGFTRILGTGANTISTDANGFLTVTVPAFDVIIYQGALGMGEAGVDASALEAAPSINIVAPADNKEVAVGTQSVDGNDFPARIEVRAEVGSSAYAEVIFAVRKTGIVSYTLIGVDDAPPYRVFYDASGWPSGTELEFAAIVRDAAGQLNADTTMGVKTLIATNGGATVSYSYAIIHYQRSDNDYGNETTGNSNDFWGLHLWGEAIDSTEGTTWTTPKPFWGEDAYGRFAWVKLADASKDVNFIVHRGDNKDTPNDRKFNPTSDSPEIWLKQGDDKFYTSLAAVQGYVTIHYHRDDNTYTSWGLHLWGDAIADGVGTTWDTPRLPDGTDSFGAFWKIPLKDASKPVNYIIHKGDTKDPDDKDQVLNPSQTAEVWVRNGIATFHTQACSANNQAILHYRRNDGTYGNYSSSDYNDYWGLHSWGDAPDPGWTTPHKPVRLDKFGATFAITRTGTSGQMGYILHKGDTKDPGPDQTLDFKKSGCEVWQLQGANVENPYLLPIGKGAVAVGDLSKYQAHWIDQNTLAWKIEPAAGASYKLYYAPTGGMTLANGAIANGQTLDLVYEPLGLSEAQKTQFPHLALYKAFKVKSDDLAKIPDLLKGQIAVAAVNGNNVLNATGIQIPGVLDALYTYTGTLGPSWRMGTPSLRLWAPTAKSVKLHLFDNSTVVTPSQVLDMAAAEIGTWSITSDARLTGKYYLYEVEVYVPSTGKVEHNLVTDPYSLGLSMNSKRSLMVDLTDPATAPPLWEKGPPLQAYGPPEQFSLYELHIRDFSINDASVPAAERGTYMAFTHLDSNGMKHLKALAQAGLTHVHLLPTFDIASINEDKSQRIEPSIPATATADSEAQQAAVNAVSDQDGFNWGYDPYHFGAPEGSYSTNPDGVSRIKEFRAMVQALNSIGLVVVMDVVYNHTNASGQAEKSVLDKIVPGYYHRLNMDGIVETSTCCQNTATEHAMMEKLMIDTLKLWQDYYGVNGFRFDLMGHHTKQNMLKIKESLFPTTYLYGEGWNFGEVANNARGVNATQLNMAGTGIGTFSDRLRDAVRGGGPFDGGENMIKNQGLINGLWYDPNALNSGSQAEKDKLLLYADQVRVGLAGNLADYSFTDRTGKVVKGSEVDYNGSPTGYTQDPQENIVYVEAHDNQTLWDISAYHHPISTTMADRIRVQNLGIDFTLLAQGVSFLHAGEEIARSKSLDRNSYNSGDWFNRLDFSYQSNNWGVGVPPGSENQSNWALMKPLLANAALKPSSNDIRRVYSHTLEMLQIRRSSPLFALPSKADVMQRVTMLNTGPNQLPGLIVMNISDKISGTTDLDLQVKSLVVLFNASDTAQSFSDALFKGLALNLHNAQKNSVDAVVKGAAFDPVAGSFTIPARTTAVFVEQEAGKKYFMPVIWHK